MKKHPAEKVDFRQGVVAGIGVLSINLSTVLGFVSPRVLSLLEIFSGENKAVIGAMKKGGKDSLVALDILRRAINKRNALLPKFKKIGYTLSTAVPDEVEGKKIDSVIVEEDRVRISFPSMRGVPVTEKSKNGRKFFSVPSFWRIEINLSRERCLVGIEMYGSYKSDDQWIGVWRPKTSMKIGPVIKTIRINSDLDLCEIVRQTGVAKNVLMSHLAQAKRLLKV